MQSGRSRPLTERDRQVLADLYEWGALSTAEVGNRHFDGFTAARHRLHALMQRGLVGHSSPSPELRMWMLTKKGVQHEEGNTVEDG